MLKPNFGICDMKLEEIKSKIIIGFSALAQRCKRYLSSSSSESSLGNLLAAAVIAVCIVFSLALLLFLASGLANIFSNDNNVFNFFGPMGDFIGGILNPILTFLMFMGVLVTILIQSKELKETRNEIRRQSNSHQEHIKILKSSEKKRQLYDAFNEAKEQYWSIAKEKIYHQNSLFDLVMNEETLPNTRYIEMQLSFLARKQDSVTLLALRLLPLISKPVQEVLIGDIEDYYKFSIMAGIITEEKMKENLQRIDEAVSVEPLGTSLLSKIMSFFTESNSGEPSEEEK